MHYLLIRSKTVENKIEVDYYGPFNTRHDAHRFAEQLIGGMWMVVPLNVPSSIN